MHFKKHLILAGICLLVAVHSVQNAISKERPNFVLIIADDMSWNDCGAYGNKNVRTPNLDQLARDGVRFDNAFVTTSSCSPSRSSIITGRYPHNTGAKQLHQPLPREQITFVELLKNSGYWTAAAGKWHLGEPTVSKFDRVKQGGGKSGCEDWLETLRSRPMDKPFFLWLAAIDPHRPYEENSIPKPHRAENVSVPAYLPDLPVVRKEWALYYDEISRLDAYVGQVLHELEMQGASENTIVLFISDNGRPFPRDKTMLYDGGIKTPWIVRWPNGAKPGTVTKSLVSTIDIAPTFLKLAGLEAGESFQGEDFSPLLKNAKATVRDFIFAEHNWHDFDDHGRAVRSTQFKYIRNYYDDLPNTPPADVVKGATFRAMRELESKVELTEEQRATFIAPRPKEELYDVLADPEELRNLAGDKKVAGEIIKMRQRLAEWEKKTADTLPRQRTPDGFNRETGQPIKLGTLKTGAATKN